VLEDVTWSQPLRRSPLNPQENSPKSDHCVPTAFNEQLSHAGQMTPCSCPGITGPHPRTESLGGVAALADHLDLLPRRPRYS
jgi:hypothetical protein